MAKKILGDDPFSSGGKKLDAPTTKKASPQKTKRAPSRKTEAPRVTVKPSEKSSDKKSEKLSPAKKSVGEKRPEKVETAQVAAPPASAPVVAIPVATVPVGLETPVALTPRTVEHAVGEPPTDSAPGSWRWWRYRQVQLARAEEATWLARVEKQPDADRFGRDPALAGRAEPIVDLLYRSWLRVSVRGLGHVPDSGRAILVVRRRSTGLLGLRAASTRALGSALDAAVIAHAIRTEHISHREVRPLVRAARFYTPLVGALLRRLGGVPSELHDFARLLDDDRLALAFVDEHAIGPRGDALDLTTIVSLALVTGAPIVPVSIASTTRAGRLGLFMRPTTTALSFGTPLYPTAEFGPEGAEDEKLVGRLATELGAQL